MEGEKYSGFTIPGALIPGALMPGALIPGALAATFEVGLTVWIEVIPGAFVCTETIPGELMLGALLATLTIPGALIPGALIAGALIPGALMPGALIPGAFTPGPSTLGSKTCPLAMEILLPLGADTSGSLSSAKTLSGSTSPGLVGSPFSTAVACRPAKIGCVPDAGIACICATKTVTLGLTAPEGVVTVTVRAAVVFGLMARSSWHTPPGNVAEEPEPPAVTAQVPDGGLPAGPIITR